MRGLWLGWAAIILGYQALAPGRFEAPHPDRSTPWTADETAPDSHKGQPYILDAFLNAAMLLGGMGPVAPELHTTAGKMFAGIYALYAGMIVLVAASILIAPVFHRFIHRFHLEQGK